MVITTNEDFRSLEAFKRLRELGLSEYESLAYLALLSKGWASPREVSEATGIPYTKVYDVLKRLERKGWIRSLSERPATYIARRPEEVLSEIKRRFESKVEETLSCLKELEERRESKALLTSFLVVHSLPALAHIVADIVRATKKELRAFITTKHMSDLMCRVELPQGARARFLVKQGLKHPRSGEVRFVTGLLPIDLLISDRSRMLLSLGRILEAAKPRIYGVVIGEVELVEAAVEYFEFMWSTGSARTA